MVLHTKLSQSAVSMYLRDGHRFHRTTELRRHADRQRERQTDTRTDRQTERQQDDKVRISHVDNGGACRKILGKEKWEGKENKAGYTATSCGRVGRGENGRFPHFSTRA